MFNKFNFFICIVFLVFVASMTGCQHSQSIPPKKTISVSEQREQLASVVAATKYLKYKCSRSDLPDDQVIIEVANRVAIQKGWPVLVSEDLVNHSDTIYLRLTRDGTQERTKCSYFNRRLRTFINEFRMPVG